MSMPSGRVPRLRSTFAARSVYDGHSLKPETTSRFWRCPCGHPQDTIGACGSRCRRPLQIIRRNLSRVFRSEIAEHIKRSIKGYDATGRGTFRLTRAAGLSLPIKRINNNARVSGDHFKFSFSPESSSNFFYSWPSGTPVFSSTFELPPQRQYWHILLMTFYIFMSVRSFLMAASTRSGSSPDYRKLLAG